MVPGAKTLHPLLGVASTPGIASGIPKEATYGMVFPVVILSEAKSTFGSLLL